MLLERFAAFVAGRRTKWLVLAFWVGVLAAAVPLSAKLTGAQENSAAGWLPGSAESTRVVELQQEFFAGETVPLVVVYERPGGLTDADRAKATGDAQRIAGLDGVTGEVAGPVPATDGEALQVLAQLDAVGGWDRLKRTVADVAAVTGDGGGGLRVHRAGPAAVNADLADAFAGIDGTLLYGALVVVILILLISYRSPVLWLLPVGSAFVALTAAQAAVYLLARYADVTVNAQTAGILLVLVFGAATDYALLLVARYREELRRHDDRHAAMAVALRRVGPALVASAATVTLGMLCLLAARMNSTRGMGPVAAVGIVIGLFAMLTLLPALLTVTGRWVFWPLRPRAGTAPRPGGGWAAVGRGIERRPRLVWVVTALALGGLAVGLVDLRTGVIESGDAFLTKPPSIVGEEALARHFPAGSGNPVVVIANAPAASAVREAVAGTPGIASVDEPRVLGKHAYLSATLDAAPDSAAAQATIDRVRARTHAVPGGGALVGGGTAINLDTQRAAARDSRVIIPIVLLAVFVILALLLRAVVAPLVLIATVVLSFAAALGASAVVFKRVLGFAGVDTTFPLFVFVFLVALGIDYNIFLMSSVQEHARTQGARRGALTGLAVTGAVITSAGLVLAGTFAVLGTLPVVATAELGFAVAFGVLLDTMVVRSVLVTALNLDLGRRMWWPGALSGRDPALVAQHDVAATPAHAYHAILSPEGLRAWFGGVRSVAADEAWPAAGSRMRWTIPFGGRFVATVVEAAAPDWIVVEVATPTALSCITQTFTPLPGGHTRYTKDVAPRYKGLARGMRPVVDAVLRRSIRREVARAARYAEQTAVAEQPSDAGHAAPA